MKCCEARAYLEAYSDTELCADRALDVEAHLSDCRACRAELELARSVSELTRSACACTSITTSFAARLEKSLQEECERQAQIRQAAPLPWSTITPLAAVAAAAFWFSFSNNSNRTTGPRTDVVSAVASPDHVVEALVRHHTAPKTPEYMDKNAVLRLEPEIGLPIRPPDLARYGARFEGAELVAFDSANAASLYYSVGGHRVTLYVYNPEELPLRATRALHPRVVHDRAVFVGQRRGYSIAACERQGVGYAIAADLSDEESAELVAALDNAVAP